MNPLSVEQIRRAARILKAQRPAYETLLACYEEIFAAQEQNRSELDFSVPKPPPDLLSIKENEALPLIDTRGFRFDSNAASALLVRICRILQAQNPSLASDAGSIARALETGFQPELLFSALLDENESDFNETAGAIGVDRNVLAFVTYCSLRPALSYCAEQLRGLRGEWEQGYCPVCGHLPGIATLDESGRRFLHCSFCWQQWSFPRTACPYCESNAPDAHRYFYSEDERDLRVDLCDSCRRYIKTIDMREARRPIYPPLEQVASLHLDLLARRQGYESGAQLPLEDGGRP